jgi:dTDP-4-amino-4,6-dideoxygalactose transaminase
MGEPEWQAIREVIESGWVTQGPRVEAFEQAMATHCGAEHAVAVSSCTTALHLSLVVAGVGPGDEVIVPSMSFIATANAVVHAGAVPVFAEVSADTFNLDLADVERRITDRTRAIVLVHQLGLPADIEGFGALAEAHGLRIVEDAACAIGSSYHGAPIGSHGELVAFSFHPRKLVTTGDGGMVLTSSSEHADRLRLLRQHGMSVNDRVRSASSSVIRESYVEVAYNYRLTDIQAAMGIEQLRRLPAMVARRQELAAQYDEALAGHPVIRTPVVPEGLDWNVQSYSVRLEGWSAAGRDAVMQEMLDAGIATRAGVMTAHREPAYSERDVSLPVSEQASDSSMVLPLFTALGEDDLRATTAALCAAVDRVGSGA